MLCKNQVVGKTKEGFYYIHPCGQCLACRINDIRAWYVRSRFEIKKEDRPFHYFLTLTYNDESLPDDGLCKKEDIKKFLNNLNTSFDLHMRYFATADYGSINNRAHYHVIILSTKKIVQSQVERIWKKGFVYLKKMNVNNLKYTLRYTVKKRPLKNGESGFFRLISKGWGDNVKEYYTGQEFFTFDGRKYGISPYLKLKLGIEKEPVDKTKYFDRLVMSPQFQNVGTWSSFVDDSHKLLVMRRKLK